MTIGLFEAQDTSGVALAEIVKLLLDKFHLCDKIIACVKVEGGNLAILEPDLHSIVLCTLLDLTKSLC